MVTVLYNKFYKGIFMITAVVAGFMIPWSEEIIDYFLGAEYGQGKVVLAIMLAYPIYQSMGQVCGTIIFALGETRRYMLICSAVMLCSVPLTYVLLASPASQIPGFSLGASGIAAKMLLIGFITGNIQAMLVSHVCGVKFDFFHQFATICLVLLSGFIAKSLSTSISMEFGGWLSLPLFTIIYSMAIIFVLVKHVDLLGMKSEELSALLTAVRTRFAL
jgi:O-antigen/teichoic acid export membrane protein